jgi:hypothetical protein
MMTPLSDRVRQARAFFEMAADRLRMASNLLDGKSQGSLAAQYLDDANYAALRGIDLLDELEAKP